ncbi:hypothetical protein [Natronorubrum aibiense]|uniref:Uncharacterized protein n=1 Tax=Natronorubrum aibiense TaxID=348826 RepID=A0A5P9P8S4_9EURY|nr:hypothetical protein [Natronorubrum aibiense]QFU84508.1 hypothetical protein GCU68_18475 [Natronorubrum aibiense]
MELGEFDIPTRMIQTVSVLFIASLVYGILIMGSPIPLLSVWIEIFKLGILLFVVYLLYRFVLAIETIAAKL